MDVTIKGQFKKDVIAKMTILDPPPFSHVTISDYFRVPPSPSMSPGK